jgi:hypothetical protein
MRRVLTASILIAIISTTCLISTAFAQKADKEGKAWLDTCSEPSTLKVTGIWKDAKWGNLTFNQHEGSRQIVGSGDGWDITGVVSGNSVCLLFSHYDRISYSAKLTADASGELSGGYVKGLLSDKSKTTPMRLVKK